jgi:hypothetical protein
MPLPKVGNPGRTIQSAVCQLGDLRWRVDPNNIAWDYQLDTTVIDTLGGQVVQILGATLGDLTVSGDLGQDNARVRQSWQLANAFHTKIKTMMDAQLTLPFMPGSGSGRTAGAERAFVHNPYPFHYNDGYHSWSFRVLVKALADGDGDSSISYTNGKFNHRYTLSLFIVQADSDVVHTIASDAFLSRIAKGIGWRRTGGFHGSATAKQMQEIVMANGGSISALLAHTLGGQPIQIPADLQAPGATPPVSNRRAAGPASPRGD